MKDYIYGIWFYVLGIIVEVFFGYLAITAQGPIALTSLGIIGLNTLIMISLTFDARDTAVEEDEEES